MSIPPIAYLIPDFPVLSHTFISREVKGLEKLGLDIRYFSVHTPDDIEISAEDDCFKNKVFYLFPLNKIKFIQAQLYFFLTKPFKYLKWLFYVISRPQTRLGDRLRSLYHFAEGVYMAKEVKKQGIQHIHAHFMQGNVTMSMVIAGLLDITYSATTHGSELLIDCYLLKERIQHSHFMVTISQYNRQFMINAEPHCGDKTHVVHCGLDPEQFLPAAQKPDNQPLELLAVGRLVWEKSYADMLESFHILKQKGLHFHCTIIGEGEERPKVEALIKDYALEKHVTLVGLVLQEKIQSFYETADIFLLSSITEGIPVVIMEAMSKQLPVIATAITGIPELVNDGDNGYLVPASDPNAFANAIEKLLSNPELREKMGIAGREKVYAEFSIKQNIQQLHVLFEQYLK